MPDPIPEAEPLLPRGLLYMALGAFWFSLMSLLVKIAGQRLPTVEVVFVRALITFALSWGLLRRARIDPWGEHHQLLLLRGLLGCLALIAFYFSIINLPLSEATVIQYTNPVFTAILAGVLLRERMSGREIACVAASLAGVVLVARPAALFGGSAAALEPAYVGIALLGALGSAGAYVTVRRLGRAEHPLVVVFYFPLVTVPLTLPFVISHWIWPTPLEWLVLLGVGVTTQVAQVYMTRGLQLEPAGRATAVGYLQILFATVWGAIVFRELPGPLGVLGALVIAGSTLLLTLMRQRDARRERRAAASPPDATRSMAG